MKRNQKTQERQQKIRKDTKRHNSYEKTYTKHKKTRRIIKRLEK